MDLARSRQMRSRDASKTRSLGQMERKRVEILGRWRTERCAQQKHSGGRVNAAGASPHPRLRNPVPVDVPPSGTLRNKAAQMALPNLQAAG